MAPETVDFDLARIGRWVTAPAGPVSAGRIAAYAAATNETDPRLRAGELAPLMFGVVPSWQLAAQVSRECAPPELTDSSVHGEHDIRSTRPIRAGDVLSHRAAVVSVRPVRTGTLVVVAVESLDERGDIVVSQRSTGFYRGTPAREGGGEPRRSTGATGYPPTRTVDLPIDPDQPARYAEASGDRSAIHLDEPAARAAGLPGVILHGMCSLAIAGRAIVQAAHADPTGLRRLACRFTDVVLPGSTLSTAVGPDLAFEVRDGGRLVISNGLAEVARG